MLDLTFSKVSWLCANAANFVRWQIWLSALVLGLSSFSILAADDVPLSDGLDKALITDAEVGSYVVRDGVNYPPLPPDGHAGLASRVDDLGNHYVLDIVGPGDAVAERTFTEFRKTSPTSPP